MKAGVIVFPGSNCDEDLVYVLRNILELDVQKLWHKDNSLHGCNYIFLPGGFSYGDYLRSGAIARFSPIMEQVVQHAEAGGFVMGICNGFQILTEAGLLPGVLLRNINMKFICDNCYITPATLNSAVTSKLQKGKAYKIPIAHAEGRYYVNAKDYASLLENDQVLFRYCDERGECYPMSNPNGSVDNIAGVCNIKRNVFGMMPHPERAADTLYGNEDGLGIFASIVGYAMQKF
jgi:phosphoribosylformylglycinamidine synthase